MFGMNNIKFANAHQSKAVYTHTDTKEKFLRPTLLHSLTKT